MPSAPRSAHETEIAVLRALLCAATKGKASTLLSETKEVDFFLASYCWSDQEHRVVYQSLCAALHNPAVSLREQMAAEATRMGHPDVDWPLYFSATDSSDLDISRLMERLRNIDTCSK